MSLLTVVRDVCATVGVAVPSTVFGGIANNRTMQEMLSLANEMAQRIAYDTRDWVALRTTGTIVGGDSSGEGGGGARTGAAALPTSFALPYNFKRLLLTSNLWRSTDTQSPMLFIPDTDEWMQRRMQGTTDSGGEWTLFGDSIHTYPAMGVGTTATYAYLDRNCIRLFSGGVGDVFMADGDAFRLDERLLKLGMIWQWKAQKGSPYAEDMGSYSDALANAMGHDQPAPIIIDRRPISHTMRHSYPWPVPS